MQLHLENFWVVINFKVYSVLQNNENIPSDADLQVALMPQELNTAFIPNKVVLIIFILFK